MAFGVLADALGLDAEVVSFASLGAERNILDCKFSLSTLSQKKKKSNEAMNGYWEQKQMVESDMPRRLLNSS